MSEIQELGFKINFDVGDAKHLENVIKRLDELRAKLETFKSLDLSKLNEMANGLNNVASGAQALSNVNMKQFVRKFVAVKEVVTSTNKTVDEFKDKILDAVNEVESIASSADISKLGFGTGKDPNDTETFDKPSQQGAQDLPQSTEKVKIDLEQTSDILKALGANGGAAGAIATALGMPELAVAIQGLQLLNKILSNIGETIKKVVVPVGKAIGKFILLPFSGVKETIGEMIDSINKFAKRIGRLTVTKALRKAISLVSAGIKEGIDNLYEYSKVVGTDFHRSMNDAATTMLYFKNSIGAMVAPLINALVPVLRTVIDHVVDFVNIINQALAKLTGAASWTRALRYVREYTSGVKDASKAIKNFNSSNDELNVIDTRSGSGNSPSDNYSQMFEEVDVDEQFATFLDDVREAIKNGEWYKAGETLAEALNDAILGINTYKIADSISSKVDNALSLAFGFFYNLDTVGYGNKLGDFLNVLVDRIPFEKIGVTFATVFQRAIDFFYGLFDRFEWQKFGLKISEYVQGWFEALNGDRVGETINRALSGLMDMISGFVSNDKMWAEIWKDIEGLLRGIDIASLISKALNLATALLRMLTNRDVISKFVDGIIELFRELNKPKVKRALKEFLIELFRAVFRIIFSAGGAVAREFQNGINSLFKPGSVSAGLLEHWSRATGNTSAANSIEDEAYEQGQGLGESYWEGYFTYVSSLSAGSNFAETIVRAFSGKANNGIRNEARNTANDVRNILNDIPNGVDFRQIVTSFDSAMGQLPVITRSASDNAVFTFKEQMGGIPFTMVSVMNDTANSVKNTKGAFENSFKDVANATKPGFNTIIGFAEKMANNVVDSVKSVMKTIEQLGYVTINGQKVNIITTPANGIGNVSLPRLANGGMLRGSGSAFIAGEQGAEWVGNFGGYTGVMNTEEMASAVSRGVYEAVSLANRGSDSNQTITVNLDGRTIWTNQANVTRERGFNLGLGGYNV